MYSSKNNKGDIDVIYGFIDATPKMNKKTLIITIIIAVFIIIAIGFGIFYYKNIMNKDENIVRKYC